MKLVHQYFTKIKYTRPTHAGLLSDNVTLLLRIATKSFSNILCSI